MDTRVKRRVRASAMTIAAVSLLGLPAAGEETNRGKRAGIDAWVPALALSGSFHGQQQESTVESECEIGGPPVIALAACTQAGPDERQGDPTASPDGPAALRSAADGSDFTLWPGVGVELHLMTPRLFDLPGDWLPDDWGPRLFLNAEITAVFPPTRTIANEGSLSEIKRPDDANIESAIPTQALIGAGSETESFPQTFQYGAQIGLAIPVHLGGRTLRIKPSFGWLQYKLDVNGRVLAAIKDDVNGTSPVTNPNTNTPFGTHTREIELEASKTLVVNGIGPGIEIEYESGHFGRFGSAVFLGANAYKVLGDTKVKLRNAETFPDGTMGGDGLLEDTYRARWTHEIDPWFYRVRVGIRFHYLGN